MSCRLSIASAALTAAFVTVGCSDAVPLPAEGAFVASFSKTASCQRAELHTGQIGNVTPTSLDTLRRDGEGADIYCQVTASGGGFDVRGVLEEKTTFLQFEVSIGSDAAVGNEAAGIVTYKSSGTTNSYTSPATEPCQFWFEGGDETVAEGRFWAQFRCPSVVAGSTGDTCAINVSTVALQNCDP